MNRPLHADCTPEGLRAGRQQEQYRISPNLACCFAPAPACVVLPPRLCVLLHLQQMLSFREQISVPAGVTEPVIKCEVSFTADGGELARQTITINTGATAGQSKGGFVTVTV